MRDRLPDTWKLTPLEDCMDAIIDYRGKTPRKAPFGIPLITAKIVKEGRIIDGEQEYISIDYYDNWMQRGLPEAGDIVMTTEGPLGEIAQLDGRKVALGQRLITLRGNPNILDNTFLKFLMMSDFVQNQLRARATGTTVQGIKQSELRKVSLLIPPLTEQQAIATILGSIDEKIEINQQMNTTLEAIATAIFKSWFVDFDPVRARMEGHKPFGMDDLTATLFPDSLEDSELGQVPKGWNFIRLNEKAAFIKGVSYRSEDLRESQVALVTLKSIDRGGGYKEEGLKPYSGAFKSEQRLQPGEVVVAHTDLTQAAEVLGRAARIRYNQNFHTLVASLDLVIVRPTDPDISNEFLYGLLSQEAFGDHTYSYANGTTVLHLSAKALPEYKFVLPPSNLIEEFTKVAKPFYQMIDINAATSLTLVAIRDTLLPRLLSGRIRVNEAEKYAEALL
jgi:type I restriction enzyme S subunit